MSLNSEEDIGVETHKNVEQSFLFVQGSAKVVSNGMKKTFKEGDGITIPPNTEHNIINVGYDELKILTVYSPPNHLPNTVHRTKEDALKDKKDEAFGDSVK